MLFRSRLMQDLAIRNIFVPPTALRMLRAVNHPRGRFNLDLRTIASAGEALGAETLHWGRESLGLTINEAYGQTECNLVIASSASIGVIKPGFIGKLGTLLGDAAVNIANFTLGRSAPGQDAICLVEVDGKVDEALLAKISKLPAVRMARALAF